MSLGLINLSRGGVGGLVGGGGCRAWLVIGKFLRTLNRLLQLLKVKVEPALLRYLKKAEVLKGKWLFLMLRGPWME